MKNKLLILSFIFASITNSFAETTYSYAFSSKVWSAYGNQTLNSVVWTAAGTSTTYFGYDTNNTPSKGQQFGSSGSPASTLSLTTSGIVGTITSLKINTCGASSIAGTVSVSVGGTAFTSGSLTSKTLTSTATDYTFTGSGTGNIVISWNQTSSKALYIKSIDITYSTCTSPNLSFATSAFNKIISDAAFTQTATSINTLTPITYSSNATGVATVNSTTGEVNIVGAGTATITATQAAGTYNSVDYCASTATYTIYVGAAAPTISITEVTAPVLTTDVGTTGSQTINIGGLYLTDKIQLSISGANSDQFSVSPNLVDQISGGTANTLITINYSPTIAGIHAATLNLTSNGAASGTISLNGTSTITATEIHSTPIENLVAGNGIIRLSANSGETIEVYTVVGQKLLQQNAIEGVNTIQISEHGVLLVKAGNRISKVIL
jgi:hypothetical protein